MAAGNIAETGPDSPREGRKGARRTIRHCRRKSAQEPDAARIHAFGRLRAVERKGEPWFVARDACAMLEIEHHRDAISGLDDDERGSVVVDTLGGPQAMAAVSESGLYALIFKSRKMVWTLWRPLAPGAIIAIAGERRAAAGQRRARPVFITGGLCPADTSLAPARAGFALSMPRSVRAAGPMAGAASGRNAHKRIITNAGKKSRRLQFRRPSLWPALLARLMSPLEAARECFHMASGGASDAAVQSKVWACAHQRNSPARADRAWPRRHRRQGRWRERPP